ncbi:hypothetical protein MVEN_02116500 [Mycena venus]|uniref:Protein kinase domain-containing protein n=1 Tax=Mycena venus TaxID=2733690 RepID=A0A8H7CI45_9AGAR|nr:hypothetical protein MVEN_02116500 [Mycena venus]
MSNAQKLANYNALAVDSRVEQRKADTQAAISWYSATSPSFSAALSLLHPVPPVIPGNTNTATKSISRKERKLKPLSKVVYDPDWLEDLMNTSDVDFNRTVLSNAREAIFQHLTADRRSPHQAEVADGVTDNFHLNMVLKPAAAIASAFEEVSITAGYAFAQNSTESDLIVFTPLSQDTERKPWIAIEDKRAAVFTAHEAEFLGYAEESSFPWPVNSDATSGLRMWMQIWGQMFKYQVDFAKIFSPVGVVYIHREPSSDVLHFSRRHMRSRSDHNQPPTLYQIIRANPTFDYIVSSLMILILYLSVFWRLLTGLRIIYIATGYKPTLFRVLRSSRPVSWYFPHFVGEGASGAVWRSVDGTEVVKVYDDRDVALHEALILELANTKDPDLPIPRFLGLVDDGDDLGVVMTYSGAPVSCISEDAIPQIRQTLIALHAIGVHHHDVRPANVLVHHGGTVNLIDFDRAMLREGLCEGCADALV